MVKLRLQRRGRKKLSIYKIVAADARAPRDGRFIEAIGEYNPVAQPAFININEERALYWLGVGAQPTDTVKSLLSQKGLMLRLHLTRKGKDEQTISDELTKWNDARIERETHSITKKQMRAQRKKAAKAETEPAAAAKAETEPAAAAIE